MLLATALVSLLQDVLSTDVYCSKQTGSSSTKGNHSSFLRFWNWAEIENCRCSQNLWRRRKCWNRNLANIRKWIARFYYFRAFILRWKRVCIAHNNCMSCPSIWATLSALLINILVPFQLLLHSDQPLRGNNPVQRCLPVGGGCIIHAGGGGFPRTDWQTALMCNRRRPAATSSRRASFSALASANSSCILHRAQQHHADASGMSVIAAFASFSSLAFLSRWAL